MNTARVWEHTPDLGPPETMIEYAEPIHEELCPTERRLTLEPLAMIEMIADFCDRHREALSRDDSIDPNIDPDAWLNFFFEGLVRQVDDYRDLLPMKLRLMPAHKAMVASRPTESPDDHGEVVVFPKKKKRRKAA